MKLRSVRAWPGRRAAIVAEGVVVGGATCYQAAVAILHGNEATKMVSEEVVVGAAATGDDALGYGLPCDGQGDADSLAGLGGVFHFVVGEGAVYDGAVGAESLNSDSIGIVAESGGLAVDNNTD